eukprot:9078190-Ditylum_brightwellii.AAC.1
MDQYGLVHVGLYAGRSTKREAWWNSFKACNLHHKTRVPFPVWFGKIQQHLYAGQSFTFDETRQDTYYLLPYWWHGTTPNDKKKMMAVVESFD